MTYCPFITQTLLWDLFQWGVSHWAEIKDMTKRNTPAASYLDVLLSIGRDGQLRSPFYDNCYDFNFHITNFPFPE